MGIEFILSNNEKRNKTMKLSLALIAMTGVALGQDATTTTAPVTAYDDYDYASLDGFGRGKGGKKKAEREKAKAAKQAAKEAAANAANNYAVTEDPYASTTKSTTTTTTTTTTTEYTTPEPYTTKRPNKPDSGYAPEPSDPYSNGGKNDDLYGPGGPNYASNGAADNNNINYGMGYGGPDNGEAENSNPNGIGCFHCDAPNFEDCYKIGKYMDCAENEGACMVEIRERDGKLESVCMGCKQIRACKAQ